MQNTKIPINVLYVSHFSHARFGGQKSLLALIEHLNRNKINPTAIVPSEDELSKLLNALNCPTFAVPSIEIQHRAKLLKLWRAESRIVFESANRIRDIIKKKNIDIIHVDEENDAVVCGIAKQFTKAKLIYHLRLTNPTKFDKLIENFSDGFIGVSEGTKRRISHKSKKLYRTIFDGVDFNIFKPAENKSALRQELELQSEKLILLFVGQIKIGKGIFDMIEAMNMLKEKLSSETIPQFLIAGKPLDDSILKKLEFQIKQYCLSDHVRILGQQKDIHKWMQACDVLSLPSHEGVEGLPRVLIEGMACGAIPLGTNTSGLREAIESKCGFLVKEKSPNEITECVLNLINDRALQTELSQNAIRSVRLRFEVRFNTELVEDFYQQIL